MNSQSSTQSEAPRGATAERNASTETTVGFAILGCLVAGTIGLFKATNMTSGADVFFCLLASVAAFGSVAYMFLRKG